MLNFPKWYACKGPDVCPWTETQLWRVKRKGATHMCSVPGLEHSIQRMLSRKVLAQLADGLGHFLCI